MNTDYDGRQVVGIDLHRRRSVIVQQTEAGQRLGVTRIDNDPFTLAEQVAGWGEEPQVVLEATYGWYWAVDVLAAAGAQVHLAHPLGVKGFAYRRVKNDERDAFDLADLLRMGRLPEAWIAPPATREVRELVRHRAKLVATRSGLKAQVHAVLAKCGVHVPMSDLFGAAGQQMLDQLRLPGVYAGRVTSLRRLIDAFGFEIDLYAKMTNARLATDPGYRAVQAIGGVGPVLAAVFVAEIGDVHRFTRAEQLCSWAGLTPRHRESDTKIRRGRITKQGSTLVRWAAVEAVQRVHRGPIAATRTASAPTAARTSAKSPPPANSSRWSTTGYATDTSVAWPDRREHSLDAARTRGRRRSDPHRPVARSMILIDPAWLRPYHSMPPMPAAKG